MNIRAMLNALLIQAPSSKPIPTLPFRSAKPSVSNRPATVTMAAPSNTPAIPSSGLFDKSSGRADPLDRELSVGFPTGTAMEDALIDLLLRSHGHDRRETGPQLFGYR